MQSNLSYILLFLLLFCSITKIKSQDIKPKVKPIPIVKSGGSQKVITPEKKIIKNDTLLLKKQDSIQLDTIKPKEVITDLISHIAKDYTTQNAKDKTVTLYNEAHVVYTDIDLKAGIIIIDYIKNTLFAKGIKDSLGYTKNPYLNKVDKNQNKILCFTTSKQKKPLFMV